MTETTAAVEENMEVVLHAEGCGRKVVTVKSFKEASEAWCQYRDENCLGASQMLRDCGKIKRGGRMVGYVSYNGRVWDMEQSEIQIDGEV
ncbi:hypothetical protein [Geomonas subterranea]|uniref:hypothetical protein n=1 Tax=Geomonas subterranea TaxID=2847989 RepID=UPI001CD39B2E|nr:hypothetical protein [Geomonas fuzhouensis]